MRKLLNTLYALSEDIYLSLDGENIVANKEKQELARYPLHTLQNIVSFSYAGLSPALMGACASRNIGIALCSPRGKFWPEYADLPMGMYFCVDSNTEFPMIHSRAARLPDA